MNEIKKLKKLRIEITRIYMKLGNFEWMRADSVLQGEIIKLEKWLEEIKNE